MVDVVDLAAAGRAAALMRAWRRAATVRSRLRDELGIAAIEIFMESVRPRDLLEYDAQQS